MNTTHAVQTLVLAFTMAIGIQTVPAALTVPPEKRADFHRLVARRDTLHKTLRKLDGQAADAIKNEEKPIKLHAEQIAAQDELDLVQSQLETLSMRWDLIIPSAPSFNDRGESDGASEKKDDAGAEFERGRQRALKRLSEQVFQMLASLDFEEFLSRTEGE